MSHSDDKRNKLLSRLTRGIAYTAPAVAVMAGGAAFQATASEAVTHEGYQQLAKAGAEAEHKGKAEGDEAEGEAEHKGKAEGEAEGEGEAGY